jgi:branched-chain amino acid transport system permease protein
MAFVYWELRVHRHWPAPLALFVVLFVLSPLLGELIERVMVRKLYSAPMRVSIVTTLALLLILLGVAESMWSAQQGRRLPPFFGGADVNLFGVRVTYHDIIVLAIAVGIAAVLRVVLYHSRTGVTMRAVVDNRSLASLNGVYPERVAQLSWALGAMLAALAGILVAPSITLNHVLLTLLVVNGYAAAMLGRLRSLPLTFVGALILGLAQAYIIGYGGGVHWGSFRLIDTGSVVPTVFLFIILVFLPHARLRTASAATTAPPRVPSLRASLISAAVFLVAMGLVSGHMSAFWLFNCSLALVLGIAMLSLVVLSGYAGQISLMQMTFVGIGALAASRLGNGTVLGLVTAGVVAAVLGAVVAMPALRLQELYLALTTLAVALFGDWAFSQSWGMGGAGGGVLTMKRLHVAGLAFKSERSQFVLAAIVFCVAAIAVLAVRRSPYGRRLAALADSPMAASTLGMNLVAVKTTVFALSAGIAGVAGALFGGLRVTASASDFAFLQSLFLFLVASFGGITTVVGALFGGVFLALMPELQKHIPISNIQYLGVGLGAIALADNPHGFGGNISDLGELLRTRWRRGPVAVSGPARTTGDMTVEHEVEVGAAQ